MVDLPSTRATVGRVSAEHAPDVVLDPDPQRWIGRTHCTLDLVDGTWRATDNASVNGTLLRRGGRTIRLEGCLPLQHADTLLVLGDMTAGGEPQYWELTLLVDRETTQQAPFTPLADPPQGPRAVPSDGPCVRYDFVEARVFRVVDGAETEVESLRPKCHQLIRFMTRRSGGRAAVACGHDELIQALFGGADEWASQRAYDRTDLAGVVRATRLRLEPDPARPTILQTVKTIGYRLRVCPGPVAGPATPNGSESPAGPDRSEGSA